ncbi:MAG: 30S ribosomal protein S8 [Firmicutes bacterium]|nr:30S ribosomal protein S8 [Bacillota bacterium]
MVMTDPIADMLTRIRNASSAGHDVVEVPASKMKLDLARILKEEGFIRDFKRADSARIHSKAVAVRAGHKNGRDARDKAAAKAPRRTGQGVVRVYLKYGPNKEKVITGIDRASRPGRRLYAAKPELPRVMGGLGVTIVSTSKGLMTDRKARKEGIGGEVVCFVW